VLFLTGNVALVEASSVCKEVTSTKLNPIGNGLDLPLSDTSDAKVKRFINRNPPTFPDMKFTVAVSDEPASKSQKVATRYYSMSVDNIGPKAKTNGLYYFQIDLIDSSSKKYYISGLDFCQLTIPWVRNDQPPSPVTKVTLYQYV